MNFSFVEKILMSIVEHYNHKKYWKLRSRVINPNNHYPKLLKYYWLFKIKRMDAFNNASMGTYINHGTKFLTPPNLPHHLNGIIIAEYAEIGKNCTIFQQVTIGEENGKAAKIGDNVMIGAGAKIIGDVRIGSHVKIGANAVVLQDIPDGCTAVGVPAKVIK